MLAGVYLSRRGRAKADDRPCGFLNQIGITSAHRDEGDLDPAAVIALDLPNSQSSVNSIRSHYPLPLP